MHPYKWRRTAINKAAKADVLNKFHVGGVPLVNEKKFAPGLVQCDMRPEGPTFRPRLF
jgi:hypothetical protein